MTTINQQEAGAFYTHAALRGLSSAEAMAELARTSWDDLPGDVAFGRRRHSPTIRRLAKPLLDRLDAQHAASRAQREAEAADRATWAALPAAVQADIFRALCGAGGNKQNRRVRDLARAHGITVSAAHINVLALLVTGCQFAQIRYGL